MEDSKNTTGKNIVICLDGTGNEFGDRNSNVIKLFSTLPRDKKQIAYYHPGLGTTGEMNTPGFFGRIAKAVKVILGNGFGYGIIDKIGNAYSFLMENYQPGDKVFIFGFSRGAYTAKALCAMLYQFGLFDSGCQTLIPYAMKVFKKPNPRNLKKAQAFKEAFGTECKPHFVGVWDTVSSVGWITEPLRLAYTFKNPDLKVVRHALSIDERRYFFRPNLFGDGVTGQDLKQVWFPGVHSDIGGGYFEKESGLAKISLEWMIVEAEKAGLVVNQEWKQEVLGGKDPYVKPNPKGIIHNQLKGLWWIIEFFSFSFGKYRDLREADLIHESTFLRQEDSSLKYNPPNLPQSPNVYRN